MRILPHRLAAHRIIGALVSFSLLTFSFACSDTTGPATPIVPSTLSLHPDLQSAAGSGTSTALLTKLASNMCMDVTGSSTAPGTQVIIWGCTGNTNQKFTWQSNGEIRTIGGMCLDDSGGQGNDGDPIIIWTCHGGPNQTWTATTAGEIKGINGKCVDVSYSSTTPGTKLILWRCTGNSNQKWDAASSGSARQRDDVLPAGGHLRAAEHHAEGGRHLPRRDRGHARRAERDHLRVPGQRRPRDDRAPHHPELHPAGADGRGQGRRRQPERR